MKPDKVRYHEGQVLALDPFVLGGWTLQAVRRKPVVLIIRDGWGINPGGRKTAKKDGNAVLLGKTPFHDEVLSQYPVGTLSASGGDVGLPDGQMGNSEVGHLNLGAGRIVYQDLSRVNLAIEDGSLAKNPRFRAAIRKAKGKRMHFIGLVSDPDYLERAPALREAALERTLWMVTQPPPG